MRLMIVDDHAATRGLIRELVGHLFDEVLECAGGEEAVRESEVFKPNFVTMDLNMQPMNGLQALKEVLALRPSARVIVVTQANSAPLLAAALRAGASHFVVKDNLDALRRHLEEQLG